MAADQERADRIRALKQERPDLTWRRIADHVGVTERSATDWQRKGGMEYDNAKKLAELFEVDVDYIWRGAPQQAPDMFPPANPLEGELGDVLAEIKAQLARQTEVLEEIRGYAADAKRMLEEQRTLKAETDEQFHQWTLAAAGLLPEASPQDSQPAPQTTGAAKTRRAAASRTP